MRKGIIIVTTQFGFNCSGCGHKHYIPVNGDSNTWSLTGGEENPSIEPSILNYEPVEKIIDGRSVTVKTKVCHLFIKSGRIEYCSDSQHELAGKTVDMVWD